MAKQGSKAAMWGGLAGLVLIAVGVVVWWYGDYSYSQSFISTWWDFVYGGIVLIVLGVLAWVGSAMSMMKKK